MTLIEENLIAIINIMNGPYPDENKAHLIAKIYNTADEFTKIYDPLYRGEKPSEWFYKYKERYPNLREKINSYKHYGYFRSVRNQQKPESNLEEYDAAEKMVTLYIQADNSYDLNTFLNEEGINFDTFSEYLKLVKRLNEPLYEEYTKKLQSNKQLIYERAKEALREISIGISTGLLPDGTKFDLFQFWKLVPFKGSIGTLEFNYCCEITPQLASRHTSYFAIVRNFINAVMPEEASTILPYIYKRKIDGAGWSGDENKLRLASADIRSVQATITNPDGTITSTNISISPDDIENIIHYMKVNRLPFLVQVFNVVLDKYISGAISKEELTRYKREHPQR